MRESERERMGKQPGQGGSGGGEEAELLAAGDGVNTLITGERGVSAQREPSSPSLPHTASYTY